MCGRGKAILGLRLYYSVCKTINGKVIFMLFGGLDGTKQIWRDFDLAKRKSSLFSSIKEILSLTPSKEDEQRLIDKGVPKSKINNGTVIMESLVGKALKGELGAIKEVLNILDEGKEQDKSNISKLYKALDDNEN